MRFVFEKSSFLSVPPEVAFSFHERPDAFRLLTPPSSEVEVLATAATLRPSEQIVRFDVRALGLRFPFAMVHTVYRPPDLFVDEQLRGFFSYWRHEHRFRRGGWRSDTGTLLTDHIEYSHPALLIANPLVRMRLASLFTRRHEQTRQALAEAMSAGQRKRHVMVTGATGLIGGRLTEIMLERGWRVTVLARDVDRAHRRFGDRVDSVRWDFSRPHDDDWRSALGGVDAIVHLAGTPLFSERWTPSFKRRMRDSRTLSTRMLVDAVKDCEQRPEVFVTASAIGIYGTDPDRLFGEDGPAANDLLADICVAWEQEARAVEAVGVRSDQARLGVVLDAESGALREMLPVFRVGLGGVLGRPDRWMNWIHLEDVARILLMALTNEALHGPINAVSPHPVTNQTFACTLARVLARPCVMRYPHLLLRLALGEAAEYASGGPRVCAGRIQEAGYEFFFDDLEPALRNTLGRPS